MMFKILTRFTLLMSLALPLAAQAKIQQQGIKTASDCTTAGASLANCLPLDSQVYVTANNINSQLSSAITNGLLGGGGVQNYLSGSANGNFEQNTTSGWSKFNTTVSGGLPTGSITTGASSITTFATTATGKIDGNYSLNVACSSACTAGQGFISDAFTIGEVDFAKVLGIAHAYSIISGASNMNFSATSSNTWGVFIYNTTTSAWMPSAGQWGENAITGAPTIPGSFQTDASSTQYRIAVICLNTTSGAVSMNFDNFVVGRQYVPNGAAMTDWVAYTPTIVGFGTVSGVSFFSRRVGDTLEVEGKFTAGTTTATGATITIGYAGANSNVSIDLTKVPSGNIIGKFAIGTSSTTIFSGSILAGSGSIVQVGAQTSTTSELNNINGSAIASTGNLESVFFSVPVTGFSSNTSMSSDTDTRVVVASAFLPSPVSSTGGSVINMSTVLYDTHGAITTGASWKYTAPVSGYYEVNFAGFSSSVSSNWELFKNGSIVQILFNTGSPAASGTSQLFLKAGEYVDIRNDTTITVNSAIFSVKRITGPSVITATESVNASYNTAASPSVGTSYANVIFATKLWDSHASYSISSGSYSCPVSGKYRVSLTATTTSVTLSTTQFFAAQVVQAGSASVTKLVGQMYGNGANNAAVVSGAVEFSCAAGDTLSVQLQSSVATTLFNNANLNHIEIERVGN